MQNLGARLVQPNKMASHASATLSDSFPKEDQAIVIDAIDNQSVDNYVSQLLHLVNRESIKAISRISNNRICVYLDSRITADNLIDKHQSITIDNKILAIRPLISRSKRIILSNVRPSIPHEVLEKALKESKVKLDSKISFIREGVAIPGCAHIVSFRRQVYAQPEFADKIPDSFLIPHEGTSFRIFASGDTMSCFLCKDTGHVAKQCSTNTQTENLSQNLNYISLTPNDSRSRITPTILDVNNDQHSTVNSNSPVNINSANNMLSDSPIESVTEKNLLPVSTNTADDITKPTFKRPHSPSTMSSESIVINKQLSESDSSLDSLSNSRNNEGVPKKSLNKSKN